VTQVVLPGFTDSEETKEMNRTHSNLNLSRNRHQHRKGFGQGIAETLAGAIILIPIVLSCIDLAVLVFSGEICSDLAKQAARAAANAPGSAPAQAAVTNIQTNYKSTVTLKSMKLTMVKYDNTSDGVVTVSCAVTIILPVSIPFLGVGPDVPIQTQHTEPIVGIASPTN